MATISSEHKKRVQKELIQAGVTQYGLLKGESRHLPSILHKAEHIGGVAYGRSDSGSAMLVATDKRMLYLDHKLMFRKSDELSYDVVSGVSSNVQGSYAGIVLHTRLGDYKIRFVNLKCARRFVRYVEQKTIEAPGENIAQSPEMPTFLIEDGTGVAEFSQKARLFLMSHDLATLSTVDPEGCPHGAAVYYAIDKNNYIYIVTKAQTYKAQNILQNPRVALTIYDTNSMQTLQMSGTASVEQDRDICKRIYHEILRPRFEGRHTEMPPIMFLPAGEYEVIVFRALRYKFSDYKNRT